MTMSKAEMARFTKMVNRVAKELDADSGYHEIVAIASELGYPDYAVLIAIELGRKP